MCHQWPLYLERIIWAHLCQLQQFIFSGFIIVDFSPISLLPLTPPPESLLIESVTLRKYLPLLENAETGRLMSPYSQRWRVLNYNPASSLFLFHYQFLCCVVLSSLVSFGSIPCACLWPLRGGGETRGHLVWWPLTRGMSASHESFPEQPCAGRQLSHCLLHSLSMRKSHSHRWWQ